MPIYEYECTKCGHQKEAWQKFSDPPIAQCDLCKGRMRKLISHSAFHLKGTGWYVTDYASKSSTNTGGNQEKGAKSKVDTARTKSEAATKTSKKSPSAGEGN